MWVMTTPFYRLLADNGSAAKPRAPAERLLNRPGEPDQ
jgi:hypothetical protein